MIGTTLGRYRITAKLGEGGMGSVWLAEDALLGRKVALKLLSAALLGSEEARQRFLREARSAGQLRHPNVATVHDVGETGEAVWIAYEFVDGESIAARCARGPLAIADAVTIAREAAAALAHAHERHVLHRDVTAGNVMVTRDGHAVLVDFGLARPEHATQLTHTGVMMGTAGYVAPEILKGEPADERGDLYALGAVLYMMLTGRLPFEGGPPEALLYRVLNEPVPPPSELRPELPPTLERVVLKLLARELAHRFATADEAAEALAATSAAAAPTASEQHRRAMARRWRAVASATRRVGRARIGVTALAVLALFAAAVWFAAQRGWLPGTRRGPRVLAVLPMRNTSSDVEATAHLGEALGEELVRRLGSSRAFRVLPWVTTVRYGEAKQSPAELGKLLHADILLMGSYRSEGERFEVHAELVDGRNGLQTWSERFARAESDLIALQSELATSVSERMDPRFSREERRRLAASAPANPEAYKYYILASSYWHSGDPAMLSLVEPFFLKAVALDSTLAEAWVGLGAVLVDRYYRGEGAGLREMIKADSMFRRALAIHPGLPAAERGIIRATGERGAPTRQIACDFAVHALERNANDLEELQTAIWGFNLGGFPELALPAINRALELDPNNQGVRFYQVMALCWSVKPMRCLAAGAEYIRRFGEDIEVYGYMSRAAFYLGRDRDAVLLVNRALELNKDSPAHQTVIEAASLYLTLGDTVTFRRFIARRIPDLEARFTSQPDNDRLEYVLQRLYELAGDEQGAQRTIARSRCSAPAYLDWSALARFGHAREAIELIGAQDTTGKSVWPTDRDSIGLVIRSDNPAVVQLARRPEFKAYQAAIDRLSVRVFANYRDAVARYFPNDPDLPVPRVSWPRNPIP